MTRAMTRTMTRTITRLTIATLAALLALCCGALAQTAPPPLPALKSSVTVSGDVVRIGDLVENAGPVADIPIFRAPDLGTTGEVATDRILDAIRPHQLIGIDTRGLAEVTVTHASRAIPAREITDHIAQALAGQYGFDDAHNILVNLDGDVRTLQVEPSATGELRVVALAYDPRSMRFDVTFDLPDSIELRRQGAHYTGTAIATVDAIAVDRTVESGEVLKESDLTVLKRPKAQGDSVLTDATTVAGLAARHQLRPGQPLVTADVMKPQIVLRNDSVTIVYQAPGLTLTLRGQAQDAGALGDTISVVNTESKRVVQAVVSGSDRVMVGPVDTTLVVDNSSPTSD
jgi:flagellar basal body P-ring formation protein FlgA